jgi:uncharacterized protein YjeT (DUF2065 family)
MNDLQTAAPGRTEVLTVSIGLILSGLAILVTGVSYLMHMEFTYQWMVWVIGLAFVLVGLITMVWPQAFKGQMTAIPEGKLRQWLIIAIPLAFIVSSQVCGLGLRACNTACHITNLALNIMAIVVALRLSRGQSIGMLLIPIVIVALIPHCICHAPINTVWHGFMGGYAPTCEMMPLAASLFAVMALRGVRPGLSSLLVLVLFAVMVFIIVGSLLFGFPWTGCVDHPMIM